MDQKQDLLSKVVSLCKRRGFVFPASEMYGGVAGFWDYGPYGAELAHNIKELWWNHFVREQENMFGLSTTVLMPEPVWRASGHLEEFTDPVVECKKCKKRFRADQLNSDSKGVFSWACSECGHGPMPFEAKRFNMMLQADVGVGESLPAYLRPEIAQGMFVNFKNVFDSIHPELPFGLAQIGRAFRNEISPRDFLFRAREFDLMEFEYFVKESEWEKWFEYWRKAMWAWVKRVGIDEKHVHEIEVSSEDRAHYSKRTIDFEFEYPFGQKELYGLAYRTDHDLKRHMEESGVDIRYTDPSTGEKFIPHVIEPTFGLGRTFLSVLLSSYREEEMNGDTRVYLKLKPSVAPVKAAVFPLLRNKPELVTRAREAYSMLKKEIPAIEWDDNGNIGKRYRRQDEIGTSHCVTIDFQTLEDETVTVRDRDTGKQERIKMSELTNMLKKDLL